MTDTETQNIIPEQTPVNPILARIKLPGSTYQLPSRGLFYTNDELDPTITDGELHIQAMSAYDEILMKSPDSLFSGEAVNKVFKRCIPQVLKPTELLAKDVDFLLVCLRQITYGNDLEISYNHNCSEEAKSHQYMTQIDNFLQHTKKINPTSVGSKYTVKLENGQVVKLRPTRFKDLLTMYQDSDPKKENTPQDDLNLTVFAINSVIESVDGITDTDMISEWITKLSAGWIATLSKSIEKTSEFGPEMKFETKCQDCGEIITIETPINPISFFL